MYSVKLKSQGFSYCGLIEAGSMSEALSQALLDSAFDENNTSVLYVGMFK